MIDGIINGHPFIWAAICTDMSNTNSVKYKKRAMYSRVSKNRALGEISVVTSASACITLSKK